MIDAHVNIHHELFDDKRKEIIQSAKDNGVKAMLFICDKLSNFDLIKSYQDLDVVSWLTAGVHPHYADEYCDLSVEKLLAFAGQENVVAVGECGLDFFKEHASKQGQIEVFTKHIKVAQITNKPLLIHHRGDDVLFAKIIEQHYKQKPFNFLMHCYTGGEVLRDHMLELGGSFSFTGIVTFKNAVEVRKHLPKIPVNKILCETDCPFLTPVPFRGKVNQPKYLPIIIEFIAKEINIDKQDLIAIFDNNFKKLFKINDF